MDVQNGKDIDIVMVVTLIKVMSNYYGAIRAHKYLSGILGRTGFYLKQKKAVRDWREAEEGELRHHLQQYFSKITVIVTKNTDFYTKVLNIGLGGKLYNIPYDIPEDDDDVIKVMVTDAESFPSYLLKRVKLIAYYDKTGMWNFYNLSGENYGSVADI